VRQQTDEPFTLLVVGDGPQRAELTQLAQDLGVADAVRFVGYRDDATQIMASSDVLCHATLFEGMPMVVLEAMTLGVPIVATRAQGITDLLDDNRSGLLVPPRDPAALAGAIVRLLASPTLRADLARNAKRSIAEQYNSDVWIARIEGIYSALVR
jgi:glycosyltransferase involved in cell wall biosynthesis